MTTEQSPLDALPICLPCYHDRFGINCEVPKPLKDWPMEECAACGRPTNQGLYLLRGDGDEP